MVTGEERDIHTYFIFIYLYLISIFANWKHTENQKLFLGYHGYRFIHSLMFSVSHPGSSLSVLIELLIPGCVPIHKPTQDKHLTWEYLPCLC